MLLVIFIAPSAAELGQISQRHAMAVICVLRLMVAVPCYTPHNASQQHATTETHVHQLLTGLVHY